jgi:transposase
MPRAYSDDLRRKILTAHDRGKGTLGELAKRFDVSLPYVKKISGQRLRTGQMERQKQGVRGPASKISPAMEALLRAQLEAVSDRTLAELQQAVWTELKVSISLTQLWRALRRMDLRLKKSRSTPGNKTAKKAVAAARRGANRSR